MDQKTLSAMASGPRSPVSVTAEDIERNIKSVHYFTADEGIYGAEAHNNVTYGLDAETIKQLRLLTFCVIILKNGFKVTGESCCVCPENYDAEKGRNYARINAIEKIWPLMGYALKETLYGTGQA